MEVGCLGQNTIIDYYIRDEFGRIMFNNCPQLPEMIVNLGEVLQLLKAYGCKLEDFKGLYFKNNNFYITFTDSFYGDISYTEKGVTLKDMLFHYCYPSGSKNSKECNIILMSERAFMVREENCLYYLDNSENIFNSVTNYQDFDNYLNVYLTRRCHEDNSNL